MAYPQYELENINKINLFDFTNTFFWLDKQQKFYSKVIVICIPSLNQRSLGLEGLFEYSHVSNKRLFVINV